MHIKSSLAACAVMAAWCLLSWTPVVRAQDASTPSTGDAVADAARQTREQKKNAPKIKKIYTDDDVSKSRRSGGEQSAGQQNTPSNATPDAAPAGNEADGKSGDATAAAPPGADKNDEAGWRNRFQKQRGLIATAEKELDILQREVEKSQVQYYPDPQKALSEQNNRKEINDKKTKIEAKKQEIDQLKQGLSDLEDALRKAGGDSGWSRE